MMAMKKRAVVHGRGSVDVAVPYVAAPEKYAQQTIHLSLDAYQAPVLRAVLEGLERRQAKLASGQPIQTAQDAIRWILEEIARNCSGSQRTAP